MPTQHLLCLWSLMLYLPLICLILLQWKHASSSVNNRRGKKNLVLSSWGDESTLSEGYINPHYISDYYKSYNERTNQNLVSSIAWSICMASFFSNNVFVLTESSFINTETLEWRCDWFRSIGRLDMLYWWELSSGCYSCFSSCKFMMTPHQLSALFANIYLSSFLPLMLLQGVAEIDLLIDRLSASVRFGGASSDWILPLHSLLGPSDQRKVFQSPPDNFRKVIMPTPVLTDYLLHLTSCCVAGYYCHRHSRDQHYNWWCNICSWYWKAQGEPL